MKRTVKLLMLCAVFCGFATMASAQDATSNEKLQMQYATQLKVLSTQLKTLKTQLKTDKLNTKLLGERDSLLLIKKDVTAKKKIVDKAIKAKKASEKAAKKAVEAQEKAAKAKAEAEKLK